MGLGMLKLGDISINFSVIYRTSDNKQKSPRFLGFRSEDAPTEQG